MGGRQISRRISACKNQIDAHDNGSSHFVGELAMTQHFTLEYWIDDSWYVGRLRGVPGVFSQGQSLEELEENIRDAYQMMIEEEAVSPAESIHTKDIDVQV
jgi:predicted RNase H-like HicB family nuclease